MSKSSVGNYFEDFALNAAVPCPTPRQITSGDVSQYIALTGDRTPRFCDETGRVHPLIVFHQALSQTVRHLSLNAIANLGYADLRFHRPVFTGQTLFTSARVIGLREASRGHAGIVWVRTTSRNGQGERVLSFVRWVLVRKRGAAPTPWADAPHVPELAETVTPDTLSLEALGEPPEPAHTGAEWALEDYAPGERIFHHDGHTITPGDHMGFTRLFQNSARVHFDARATDGRPLVFGGYPMSIGYAQMHSGLHNRMGLAAINSGTHAHPVHAGDTLYAMTEIIESHPLGDAPAGALRCRLRVFKDLNPADHPGRTWGAPSAHPEIALDLDLWELIPKRAHMNPRRQTP